jgi:polyphosphate kinase
MPRCGGHHAFLLIEDLVAATPRGFSPGETVTATTAFRVTRNGDIAVQEEDAIDLADEMEDVLTARRFADTVRLELRADAPRDLARMIREVTAAGPQEIYQVDGPPGLASFMELAFLPDSTTCATRTGRARTRPPSSRAPRCSRPSPRATCCFSIPTNPSNRCCA